MYQYYLFDLDRTLWDFDRNAKNAIFKLIEKQSLMALFGFKDKELFFKRYEVVNHKLWNQYEAGEISKEYLRSARFFVVFTQYLSEQNNLPKKAAQWSKEQLQCFADNFATEYLSGMTFETELEPNAAEVLSTLKERGAKIAIITNGFKEVQYRKLNNSNIAQFIDSVIISEEVGVHKPNPIIFKKALESLCGTQQYISNRSDVKKHTLMIGDDFANDIEGAQVFGIDQFYYNPSDKPCDGGPTYQSNNLIDILSL